MNESTKKETRRNGVIAVICLAVLTVVAAAAGLHLACTGSGFDLIATTSHMTWGTDGYTVAFAALALPFATLAAPRGARR